MRSMMLLFCFGLTLSLGLSSAFSQARQNTQECQKKQQFSKSMVIARFLRSTPSHSTAGNLYGIEEGLPLLVQNRLQSAHELVVSTLLNGALGGHSLTETQRKQQARQIAQQESVQFVLGGEILDMTIENPASVYTPNLAEQALNLFNNLSPVDVYEKRERRFRFKLELRDGFTGDLLLERHFATSAPWQSRRPMGFDSPAFHQSRYGKAMAELINSASEQLMTVISCQPFMARLNAQPGQLDMLLQGGTGNGLSTGTELNLYQVVMTNSIYDYQAAEVRLVKQPTNLELREVYPSHSVAHVKGDTYLNGHYLAVSNE
jgi:Flagellar assembly protein T, middle domain